MQISHLIFRRGCVMLAHAAYTIIYDNSIFFFSDLIV